MYEIVLPAKFRIFTELLFTNLTLKLSLFFMHHLDVPFPTRIIFDNFFASWTLIMNFIFQMHMPFKGICFLEGLLTNVALSDAWKKLQSEIQVWCTVTLVSGCLGPRFKSLSGLNDAWKYILTFRDALMRWVANLH